MPLTGIPSVEELTRLQFDLVDRWHRAPIDVAGDDFLARVARQHEANFRLWHEEDRARDPRADDAEIASVKRSIDRWNQSRNDLIEQLDEAIAAAISAAGVITLDGARLNTETPGSAIDRLSILALRLFHYRAELGRPEVDDAHRERVRQRIRICEVQHADLSRSLQELLNDLFAGKKRHRVYRQLKMYNDPSLNPEIYGKRTADPPSS